MHTTQPTTRHRRSLPVLIGASLAAATLTLGAGAIANAGPAPDRVEALDAPGLVGWATENGGTTGGAGGPTVTVTDEAGLADAVQQDGPAIVQVSGTINLSDMVRVGSDKTITGGGTITGNGFTLRESHNVIIQGLYFDDWDDDAINVETESTNVWIDHNTFGVGYDGAVDVKRGSDFVTISWNHVRGHNKTMLLGHSDDNGSQDIGHLRVTYHHNWFDGTEQRNPRVRFGNPVHVFNNYYASVGGYGVASTEDAGVLVEGNFFEDTDDPFHLGEGSSGPGTLVARDNHFVNSGEGEQGGSVAAIPYAYTLDSAADVKSIVSAGAGAGNL
ncbi:pectate lyase [Polymorphospora sp. NPDC050346]|uniref:pectate lyase family protein n=1 Tax=Polymorphospora sp. NPDC050346 TaxID=3155780 RepID=UPI0034026168